MVTLRFNLGRGVNYKKWQVKVYNNKGKLIEKHHFDPAAVRIFLLNARLRNNKTIADAIYEGKNKSVCAWVEATKITVNLVDEIPMAVELLEESKLRYNPRKAPYWTNHLNQDRDNEHFSVLVTDGKNLFDISNQVRF